MSIRAMVGFAVVAALFLSALAGFGGYEAGIRVGRARAEARAKVAAEAAQAKYDKDTEEAMIFGEKLGINMRSERVCDMVQSLETNAHAMVNDPEKERGTMILVWGIVAKAFPGTSGGDRAKRRADELAREAGVELR